MKAVSDSDIGIKPKVPSGKDRTLFDWDQHGWMLWVNKEAGVVAVALPWLVLGKRIPHKIHRAG